MSVALERNTRCNLPLRGDFGRWDAERTPTLVRGSFAAKLHQLGCPNGPAVPRHLADTLQILGRLQKCLRMLCQSNLTNT